MSMSTSVVLELEPINPCDYYSHLRGERMLIVSIHIKDKSHMVVNVKCFQSSVKGGLVQCVKL